jgi:hypothetical protein
MYSVSNDGKNSLGVLFPRIYSVHAIRVKWTPKPDPVKRRPPTARRFYFTEPAVPWVYIFVTSHVLAHVVNAPPVAAYPRYPPRRFVSFPSAAPTAPPGSAFLAFPGCHRVHLDLNEPQPLDYTTLSNRPGADDDADDDASCQLRHSVLGSSPCSARKVA